MSSVSDDLEHVIVIPGGFLAPAAETGLSAPIAGDKVEGDLADEGKVARSRTIAHAAIILTEGDVQHPMQRVLDTPVSADSPDQDGGIVATTREEVADLRIDLADAGHAADCLHRQHGVQVWPAA